MTAYFFFSLKYSQGFPEDWNTVTLGSWRLLNPNALHPFGWAGSQVT
ncbi:hypothetical protein [Desulfobacter hydrogenophilus]|nr:hypothetical protein [Desulfobacter hydrogenophilus]NDY71761.1 hypothetical protein [Desulfobacter hydrogenophilus]